MGVGGSTNSTSDEEEDAAWRDGSDKGPPRQFLCLETGANRRLWISESASGSRICGVVPSTSPNFLVDLSKRARWEALRELTVDGREDMAMLSCWEGGQVNI